MSAINYYYNYIDKTDFNKFQKVTFVNYLKAYYIKIIECVVSSTALKSSLINYVNSAFDISEIGIIREQMADILNPTKFWTNIYYIIQNKPVQNTLYYYFLDNKGIIHESSWGP